MLGRNGQKIKNLAWQLHHNSEDVLKEKIQKIKSLGCPGI